MNQLLLKHTQKGNHKRRIQRKKKRPTFFLQILFWWGRILGWKNLSWER